MDIEEIHKRVMAEISLIHEMMGERSAEIARLTELNAEADERILTLQKAEEKIKAALGELVELGPLMNPKSKDAKTVKTKRLRVSKIVPPIVEDAGLSGITIEEIVKFHYQKTGQEINAGSVRSILYKMAHEGKVERREDGAWRVKQPSAAAAD